ncbi:hypothetical protein, partial [Prosthecochloris ethylica]|uniref:hypothetical protein n=1 Tax=Prosthecochloris ethylica TaxID=2743976 RepID=UPI001A8C9CC2
MLGLVFGYPRIDACGAGERDKRREARDRSAGGAVTSDEKRQNELAWCFAAAGAGMVRVLVWVFVTGERRSPLHHSPFTNNDPRTCTLFSVGV